MSRAKEIRTIHADEIQSYVKTIRESSNSSVKALLLLYKDSRYDMAILDELYGEYGWQTSYECINGVLFCTISVWDERKGMWISKQSNGTESNMDAKKGEASDALKRAGFLWGIGRELYTAPTIKIDLDASEYNKDARGYSLKPWVSFAVSKINYDEKNNICELEIVDNNGNKRFSWPPTGKKSYFSEPIKGREKLEKPVEKVERQETSNGFFKPMAVYDSSRVYNEIVAWVGKDRARTILNNMGFFTPKEILTMTEEQYHEIVKLADNVMKDAVEQEVANA